MFCSVIVKSLFLFQCIMFAVTEHEQFSFMFSMTLLMNITYCREL